MKALLNRQKTLTYVQDFPEPKSKRGEVKVKVHYTSLNPTDVDIAHGHYDLFFSLSGALSPVRTGLEFSGTVVEDCERFNKGDKVMGYTRVIAGPKTHQEILSIDQDFVALMPESTGFAEAAAIPVAAQTCLVALRDVAELQADQTILINGASGGLGVFAIQMAKELGAHVTAVAGPAGQQFMTSLGADETINYQQTSIFELGAKFDVLFDLSTRLRFKQVRALLTRNGVFIPADPMKNALDFVASMFRPRSIKYLMVDRGNHQILTEISAMFDAGKLFAPKCREFAFSDFEDAIHSLRNDPSQGRIVLNIDA